MKNKDVGFIVIVSIWIIGSTYSYFMDYYLFTPLFISFMIFIISLKRNTKFGKWLEKDFKKKL